MNKIELTNFKRLKKELDDKDKEIAYLNSVIESDTKRIAYLKKVIKYIESGAGTRGIDFEEWTEYSIGEDEENE